MNTVSFVCVFCGSRTGENPAYAVAARELGAEMARRKKNLVFGAGSIGIMGIVARAVAAGGGTTVGVIPEFLDQIEVGMRDVTEFIVTPSMHARKAIMFERSDAFVTLPGGLGSLDETFEILTWKQLGLHDKPVIIADIDGYWGSLISLLEQTVKSGFAAPSTSGLYTVVNDVAGIFRVLDDCGSQQVEINPEHL